MIWLLLLGALGFTLVVTTSTIAAPVRRLWPALLTCAQCTGFWVGGGVGAVYGVLWPLESYRHLIAVALAFAFATSILAYLPAVWLHEHNPPHDS